MSKGLMDFILDNIIDDDWKGRHGEKLTERKLKVVQLFGRKGKVLRNVYLPKDKGETSEVDVVFITQKGIFVIESKNYTGWIFGDEKSRNWTAMLPNCQKNHFYNPIMQNRTHLKWMQSCVGDDVPLFSLIVFSERCELKKIIVTSADVKVIKRDQTYAAVKKIWDSNPDAVSEEKVEEIYEKLQEYTNVDAAVKAAHIDSIEKKYKTTVDKESVGSAGIPVTDDSSANTTSHGICPKCGSALVLRVAKRGANAGQNFYGCSTFPKCRYTEKAKTEQ